MNKAEEAKLLELLQVGVAVEREAIEKGLTPCISREEMIAYAEQNLSQQYSEHVIGHICACTACGDLLTEVQRERLIIVVFRVNTAGKVVCVGARRSEWREGDSEKVIDLDDRSFIQVEEERISLDFGSSVGRYTVCLTAPKDLSWCHLSVFFNWSKQSDDLANGKVEVGFLKEVFAGNVSTGREEIERRQVVGETKFEHQLVVGGVYEIEVGTWPPLVIAIEVESADEAE